MAITSQAKYFLNAFYVLQKNEVLLQAEREERARVGNLCRPEGDAEEIGFETDLQTGVVDFVCIAFAVELYLKAVFEALGINVSGHNIRSLFEKLPIEAQNNIFDIQMENSYGANLENYKDLMNVISNGFTEFRYSYEKKELFYHKGFALSMINALEKYILELRKKKSG